jgi:hypothetical protein
VKWVSFVLAALYVPAIPGAALTSRWAFLSIALPFMAYYASPRRTLGAFLGATFLGGALLSLAWSPILYDALNGTWMLCLMALGYMVGTWAKIEDVYTGFAWGVCLSVIPLGLQLTGLWPLQQSSGPSGLFVNKNFLAEAALIALIPAAYYWRRLWPTLPGLIVCAAIPFSKGVVVAGCAVMVAWLWPRSKALSIITFLLCVNGALFYALDRQFPTVDHRLAIWQDTVDGLTGLGHGIGSYRAVYPKYASRSDTLASRPEHAHNEYLEIAFEHGILLAVFMAFAGVLLASAKEPERLILIAIFTLALFSFPLRLPATAFMFALVAGHVGNRGLLLGDAIAYCRRATGIRIHKD